MRCYKIVEKTRRGDMLSIFPKSVGYTKYILNKRLRSSKGFFVYKEARHAEKMKRELEKDCIIQFYKLVILECVTSSLKSAGYGYWYVFGLKARRGPNEYVCRELIPTTIY